jgi:hypothetical protein
MQGSDRGLHHRNACARISSRKPQDQLGQQSGRDRLRGSHPELTGAQVGQVFDLGEGLPQLIMNRQASLQQNQTLRGRAEEQLV